VIARHAAAIVSARRCTRRYAAALGITSDERRRYRRKAVFCGLCFVGLGARRTWREAWLAGRAAFLSTAFDVATDWRRFDARARRAFAVVLADHVDAETARLALALYDAKRDGRLDDDGLARGAPAVALILRVMECEEERTVHWGDVAAVGRTLQVIDDVLDLDGDRARREANCLMTPRASVHLASLVRQHESGELRRWFGRTSVLAWVVRHAVTRARALRADPDALTTAARGECRPGEAVPPAGPRTGRRARGRSRRPRQ
jgi:hypothetical protein